MVLWNHETNNAYYFACLCLATERSRMWQEALLILCYVSKERTCVFCLHLFCACGHTYTPLPFSALCWAARAASLLRHWLVHFIPLCVCALAIRGGIWKASCWAFLYCAFDWKSKGIDKILTYALFYVLHLENFFVSDPLQRGLPKSEGGWELL